MPMFTTLLVSTLFLAFPDILNGGQCYETGGYIVCTEKVPSGCYTTGGYRVCHIR